MVGVAQLVELSVVVRVVAGSSPVAHPIFWLRSPLSPCVKFFLNSRAPVVIVKIRFSSIKSQGRVGIFRQGLGEPLHPNP